MKAIGAFKRIDDDCKDNISMEALVSSDLFLPPKVCVVVLNWRDAKATIACLESLVLAISSGQACVVVCDNDSGDGSGEAIEIWAGNQAFPKYLIGESVAEPITVIQTGKNGGYAFGNNRGIEFALQYAQFEYIWILNNDTQIEAGSLQALLDYAENEPEAGVIGSTIVDMEDPDIVQCAGGCRYYPALSAHKPVGQGQRRNVLIDQAGKYRRKIDYISGAAFFMRIGLIRQIGLLCEDFFLYFEELDFTRRMNVTRYTFHWCPESVVRHVSRSPKLGDNSPARQYHAHLSALMFTTRWHPYFLPLVLLLRMTVKPLVMLTKGQGWLVPHGFRGIFDFLWSGGKRVETTSTAFWK